MEKAKAKAFTLIELLVVIAIIGLLASIVVVSTRSTIIKGKDAQIQAAISQVRNVAEMIMSDDGQYNSLCNADFYLNEEHDTYGSQLRDIVNQVTTANGKGPPRCFASANTYCVHTRLASPKFFCVDNTGKATTTSENPDCLDNHRCP